MFRPILKTFRSTRKVYEGQHRYEHWYVDNQIYFITARCRDQFSAFESDRAKAIFWDRFEHYRQEFGFEPWVTSLLNNHYHTVGYLRVGINLKKFMQRLHGSVAKLVNDVLLERRADFWRDGKGEEYFDGCLRSEKQGRATYRYVLTQCRRHRICDDYRLYAHTRIYVPIEDAIRHALNLNAFLTGVPYKRYEGGAR